MCSCCLFPHGTFSLHSWRSNTGRTQRAGLTEQAWEEGLPSTALPTTKSLSHGTSSHSMGTVINRSPSLYLRVKAQPIKAVLTIFASLCAPPQSSWLILENPKQTSKLCLWNKAGRWQKWSQGEIFTHVNVLGAHPSYDHTCVCLSVHPGTSEGTVMQSQKT